MPLEAFDLLWTYADRSGLQATDYLLRSHTARRPLSVRRTGSLIRAILDRAANGLEARRPGEAHSLRVRGNSHRFRHTLAQERADELYEAGATKEEAAESLMQFFGWSKLEHGRPYLDRFFLGSAEKLLRKHRLEASI